MYVRQKGKTGTLARVGTVTTTAVLAYCSNVTTTSDNQVVEPSWSMPAYHQQPIPTVYVYMYNGYYFKLSLVFLLSNNFYYVVHTFMNVICSFQVSPQSIVH